LGNVAGTQHCAGLPMSGAAGLCPSRQECSWETLHPAVSTQHMGLPLRPVGCVEGQAAHGTQQCFSAQHVLPSLQGVSREHSCGGSYVLQFLSGEGHLKTTVFPSPSTHFLSLSSLSDPWVQAAMRPRRHASPGECQP
jgi:hypothetical protein